MARMQPMLLGKAADLPSRPVEDVFFGKAQHRGGRQNSGGSSKTKRGGGGSGGGDDDVTCWHCGAQGHRKHDCPAKAHGEEARRKDLAHQDDRSNRGSPVLAASFLAAAF